MSDTYIVIQARMQSTRLPGKVLRKFYGELTILDIIIQNIKKYLVGYPVIIATSLNEEDNPIYDRYKNTCIVYRGDNENVLHRFISCSREYNIRHLIRVCADNPFLNISYLKRIINEIDDNRFHYIAYRTSDNIPAIKTHLGLFAEYVSKEAMLKIAKLTTKKIFQEHVTNFIYKNDDLFNVKWLDLPPLLNRHDLRFTIDTGVDFMNAQFIYSKLIAETQNVEELIKFVDSKPSVKKNMLTQIKENSK